MRCYKIVVQKSKSICKRNRIQVFSGKKPFEGFDPEIEK